MAMELSSLRFNLMSKTKRVASIIIGVMVKKIISSLLCAEYYIISSLLYYKKILIGVIEFTVNYPQDLISSIFLLIFSIFKNVFKTKDIF